MSFVTFCHARSRGSGTEPCPHSPLVGDLKVLVREQFVSVFVAVARFLEPGAANRGVVSELRACTAGEEIERGIVAAGGR